MSMNNVIGHGNRTFSTPRAHSPTTLAVIAGLALMLVLGSVGGCGPLEETAGTAQGDAAQGDGATADQAAPGAWRNEGPPLPGARANDGLSGLANGGQFLSLTATQLRARCDTVKARANAAGITNALIIAGIANHETGMAQCYDEYSRGTACGNVGTSSDCPGANGVLGGGGDGICSNRQGGVGMFQLDNGTYTDTTNRYGSSILNVAGNTDAAVEFIIDRLGFHCTLTPTFRNRAEAIAWFNSATPGTAAYDTYMHALAGCYNGCLPGYTGCAGGRTHEQMAALYRNAADSLVDTLGSSYWYTNTSTCQYRCSDYGFSPGQCFSGWQCDSAGQCLTQGCTATGTGTSACQYRCSTYNYAAGQCSGGWQCDSAGQCLTQGCTATGTGTSACQYRCSNYGYAAGQCLNGWQCDSGGQCLTQGCTATSTGSTLAAPPAPGGVSVGYSGGADWIRWAASSSATSYAVFWSTASGVTAGSMRLDTTSLEYAHSGVVRGYSYFYRVAAINAAGMSPLSAEVGVTVP